MSLHDSRRPRGVRSLACGVLSVGLTLSCTGNIMDDVGTEPGQTRGPRGTNPVNNILPPAQGPNACESKQFTPARVWRISDEQYVAAVKDLVPGMEVPTILTPGRSIEQFIDFA